MDVVNLIRGLGDDFGMLLSLTWSGEVYKRILESGEVSIVFSVEYCLLCIATKRVVKVKVQRDNKKNVCYCVSLLLVR